MSVERTLTTLLGLYQDAHDDAKTEQIYATTTTLLTHLSNPLNLSLLTSQLLTAPAIWGRQDHMRACYRVISVFNTAAIYVRRSEEDDSRRRRPRAGGGLSSDSWARAIIKGAGDQSPRWRHLLVFTGMLMGMEGGGRQSLSHSLRGTLEQAVVTAANLALEEQSQAGQAGQAGLAGQAGADAVVLALNYASPLLWDPSRTSINYDLLLPFAARALFGEHGLDNGSFLSPINDDIVKAGSQFAWMPTSPSFLQFRALERQPLVSGMGTLSKLLAYAVERTNDSRIVLQTLDDLVAFTESLLERWRYNKLCEVEPSDDAVFLVPETRETTWPALWQLFRKTMYAVVAILHPVLARSLLDRHLKSHTVAPTVATKALRALRNLCFVSSQQGNSAFQVYKFTYMASIDILTQSPDACRALLEEFKPATPGCIPDHPLLRTLDLFYLNLAEHLPLSLGPDACDVLIVKPATAYLTPTAPLPPRMVEIFESAHSAILSVLSCPGNAPLTVQLAPSYADTLFASFPTHISPHQFRLAFKTMVQILSPPFPISATHPTLAETFLEMIRFRIGTASPVPVPTKPGAQGQSDMSSPASEQSTLVMTLIDCLPFIHLGIFEEWMTLSAESVHDIEDLGMRESAKRRFWEMLVNGEMDVERAAIGVSWWGAKGGRHLVLHGKSSSQVTRQLLMSGAI